MGYSASHIDTHLDHDNPDFDWEGVDWEVMKAERIDAVWAALEHAEVDAGIGHISWVNSALVDERPKYATTAEAVASVLRQYGFEDTEADDDGNVRLGYWGGDKLGSCWDHVTQAIAQGTDPDMRIDLIMCGEDQMMWCQRLHHGESLEHTITINVV